MTDLKNNSSAFGLIFLCWLIATTATVGSLFFSEVMEFLPCMLCWYQRIFMYPLVLIFLCGLLPLDRGVFKFSLPLVVGGLVSALYHNLLHWGIIPESATPCRSGVSCSAVWIDWGGFITIPLLSLLAFSLLLILLIIFYRRFIR